MRGTALQFRRERSRQIVAVLFAVYLLAAQAGVVVAGAGTSNPGP